VRGDRVALALALAASPSATGANAPSAIHGARVERVAQESSSEEGAPPLDPVTALHALLARQLEGEADAIDRARAAVADKLAAADHTRTQRLRAAYRLLAAVPGDDPVGVARGRAAARLLLGRDAGERGLLVEEDAQLAAAGARIAAERAQLPSIGLPGELARPATGAIARTFGTLAHERSKATLARRGIDLEVDDHSPVVAPASGTVRYAGPIRGLDQGVILDHGGYLTVIAKLGEVALPVGAPIAAGDRLGRAARHRVYLEVRVKLGPGGLPIDPGPLLARPR
jgi:murein DD-endopeptidase MepM/ murein hydrolase activator NlpD